MGDYQAFLKTKEWTKHHEGITRAQLNKHLFPFQVQIVEWALRNGKAAIFADCGLGKTPMQLDWSRVVSEYTGKSVLILAPLAVSQQTILEGDKFGIPVSYVRGKEQIQDRGIYITNYEMLGRFDPSVFGGVVLDESSILKSYTGKFRTQIIESFVCIPFKLACTATPAPNDNMELGNHSEFLGIMKREEMLSMFFVHDGGETQKWRIKGHARDDFWRWCATWAAVVRKPSDLGFDDNGFTLPKLNIKQETVDVSATKAKPTQLFAMEAQTLSERLEARRESIDERSERCAEIVNGSKDPWVIWCNLNKESEVITKLIPGAVEVKGSDKREFKEKALLGFVNGEIKVLVTKPSIAGFGMNWQHCHNQAFVGLSDSYEQFYQAVRRCWRFGQQKDVDVHVITASTEGAVLRNIKRKEQGATEMGEEMVKYSCEAIKDTRSQKHNTHNTQNELGESWEMVLGDVVESIGNVADDSIDYTIFSPPFASLYTYSDSPRDMGNSKTNGEFFEHFSFLVGELLRVTQPGRLLSFHCMNYPTSKVRDGVIGLNDFRGQLIKSFTDAGWIYHSEVVIWKDPVTAMQRTKALGLLWKQLKKDSAMCRQGIPDYLVTMRKPGENQNRITHTSEEFPVEFWQRYASPVWMDINPSRTLQHRSAREEQDERHICPLQLDVIERALDMWSAEGDLVLSPFAGIGSEGYCAVRKGRRFLGIELKKSYFDQAVNNLKEASGESSRQLQMFG